MGDARHVSSRKQVATDRQTDGLTDIPKTTSSVRAANPKRNAPVAKDQAVVVAAVAEAINGISGPRLDVRLRAMFAAGVGDLLRGGYDLPLIRQVAVGLAVSKPQKLADIRVHVRQKQSDLDFSAHNLRLAEAKDTEQADPRLAKVMLMHMKHMLEGRDTPRSKIVDPEAQDERDAADLSRRLRRDGRQAGASVSLSPSASADANV